MDLEENDYVDMEVYINDDRVENDFRTNTFSKFNKNEVKKTLLSDLSKGRIENACYWCAELVCSGHLMDIWEIFLFYLGKNIYLGNPKLIFYLKNRWDNYDLILSKYKSFDFRNDKRIRKLFAEIICILSQSKKRQCIEPLKISIVDDFDITYISTRLKAPSTEYSSSVFKKNDPKGFFIAINELCYSISNDGLDITSACYWIEWILEFDIVCKKKKKKEDYVCEQRYYLSIHSKYQKDVVWILWDAFFLYAKSKDKFRIELLQSLLDIFCIQYTSSLCKKRRYLLYLATGIIIDHVEKDIDLIINKEMVVNVVKQIDDVYNVIKKNETVSNKSYLFTGLYK